MKRNPIIPMDQRNLWMMVPGESQSILKRADLKGLILAVVITFSSLTLVAQSKYAMIVGNSNYEYLEVLKNPSNDANDMSRLLWNIGFTVDTYRDVKKEDFQQAIRSFGREAKNHDIVLFYYAGHGIEISGKNYFVPIDALANSSSEVRRTCVSANAVTHLMRIAKTQTNIIILDACRSNPFRLLPSDQLNDGLALMDAPAGTIISFATAPGKVASDGIGRNGVFTDALLTYLAAFDTDILDVFANVRNTVVRKTDNKQIPWESTSLTEPVVLRPKPEVPLQLNVLEGDSVIFEGNGELHATSNLPGVSFYWYRDGHQFSNNPTAKVNATGKYQVKAISKSGQVLLSEPTRVTVKSFVDPQPYILEGRSVTFDNEGKLHGKSNVRGNFIWFKEKNKVGEGPELEVNITGVYTFQVETNEGLIATSESISVRINNK